MAGVVPGCAVGNLRRALCLELPTGAELRSTNADSRIAVLCVNGGQAAPVPGTWSASLEWLVERLAPRLPDVQFVELRYRVKSWRQLESCVADARAALAATDAERILLLGFSMGGAVAVSVADDPRVEAVLGLAPWLHDRLDVSPLAGKRFDVLHGSLDRYLPGIPGVSPVLSRRGFERALAAGAEGEYALIPGALHAIALRAPWGRALPLPRAPAWSRAVATRLEVFAGRAAPALRP
jgi:pimeloyl-ACP methyl ester carboxylesterase